MGTDLDLEEKYDWRRKRENMKDFDWMNQWKYIRNGDFKNDGYKHKM